MEPISRERIARISTEPDPVMWQFRWTNPANKPDVTERDLAWEEVVPRGFLQGLDDRLAELKSYTYGGKPMYEVRALYAAPPPAIHDGQKLMPVELTREMLDAAKSDLVRDGEIDPMLKRIYSAMIDAAPQAPEQPVCKPLTEGEFEYLKSCAKGATKGEWIAVGTWVENTRDSQPDIVCTPHDFHRGGKDSYIRRQKDASYIAAAQPSVVMQLIREIEILRAQPKPGPSPMPSQLMETVSRLVLAANNASNAQTPTILRALRERTQDVAAMLSDVPQLALKIDPKITLDLKQATDLLGLFGGEPCCMTLTVGSGHDGMGLYAFDLNYPEEGATFLGSEADEEAIPDEKKTLTDEQIAEIASSLYVTDEAANENLPTDVEFAQAIERACASAWGVTLKVDAA